MPLMSATMHSTSVTRRSLSHCWKPSITPARPSPAGLRPGGVAEGREQPPRDRVLGTPHSGCHWSASAKPWRPRRSPPRSCRRRPPPRREPGASRSMPWPCSEFTSTRPHRPGWPGAARRGHGDGMGQTVALGVGPRLVGAVVEPARAARGRAGAACRRAPRSAPGGRGRSRAAARRARPPAGSAAAWSRRGPGRRGCPRAPAARRSARVDVRRAAGDQQAVQPVEQHVDESRSPMAGTSTGRPPAPWTTASTYLSPTVWKCSPSRGLRHEVTPIRGAAEGWKVMTRVRR
jgi:hypothetical protein